MGIKTSKPNVIFTNINTGVPPDILGSEVQRRKQNGEEITLVWLDEHKIDHSSNGNEIILRKQILRQINDYCKFYDEQNSCVEYIYSIKNEKVFLVIPGSCANDILIRVHDLEQVDSVFIFCMERNKYLLLMNDYSKVVGIYTKQNDLIENIQKTVKLVEKQLITLNLYDQKQKSTRDLTTESGSFLFFQLFKDVLLNMLQTPASKREMIDKCREYYRGNKKELENIELFNLKYKTNEAIQWYTKNCFIYKLVNKALRTEDIEELFIYRFFIVDLSSNLMKKYKDLKKTHKEQTVIYLYRGADLPSDELNRLKVNIGNLISTNGFLSTSRCRNVALMFASNVIFEIETDIRLKTVICADIADISSMSDEQEVLFDL
ncbi:unnamed protein product, partial [Didymodactylos carnosus]